MDVKNEIFWSQIRSRFGELCGTPYPHQENPGVLPPPPRPVQPLKSRWNLLEEKEINIRKVYLFIYLFIYSKPFAMQTLTLPLCQTCRHFSSQDRR